MQCGGWKHDDAKCESKNRPSAAGIHNVPRDFNKLSDLPPAPFLTFVISGNCSSGYKPEDVPIVDGHRQFQPDVVGVRVEPEFSTFSVGDEQQRQLSIKEDLQHDSTGVREYSGLTCFVPKNFGPEWGVCKGTPTKADANFTSLRYRTYGTTPFILVLADYPSSRYGRIHIFWQAWTVDLSNVPAIDAAIWESMEEWNLSNPT